MELDSSLLKYSIANQCFWVEIRVKVRVRIRLELLQTLLLIFSRFIIYREIDVCRLCAKLEFLLHSSIKEKSVFGSRKNYWHWIYACLKNTKGLADGLKYVQANREVW